MRRGSQRAAKHVGAAPHVAYVAVARQRDREILEACHEIGSDPLDALRLTHQQRAVQRPIGNGIRGPELPAWKMRLHDLDGR
jgi:hypothetical protein